ncbi:hypothetical protein ES703_108665 [subsurface metagenome]
MVNRETLLIPSYFCESKLSCRENERIREGELYKKTKKTSSATRNERISVNLTFNLLIL